MGTTDQDLKGLKLRDQVETKPSKKKKKSVFKTVDLIRLVFCHLVVFISEISEVETGAGWLWGSSAHPTVPAACKELNQKL